YRLSTLYDNLGKIPAKSITVVLEACFSGASESGAVISNASPVFMKPKATPIPANVTVIAAGAPDQMASWEKDKSHGLFTKYFLIGMSGEADAKPYGNADGKVEYNELDAYLKETLTYYARRHYGRDQTAQIVVGKDQ
ncbi:MAG: peptidase C14, partial [Rhodospirillales bacterium]|nr:peptidase C14 [Rhodospirillales bacterium]